MAKPDVLMVGHYPDWETPLLGTRLRRPQIVARRDRARFLERRRPAHPRHRDQRRARRRRQLIDACPKLEIIACFGVGFDAIDLERAKAREIRSPIRPTC